MLANRKGKNKKGKEHKGEDWNGNRSSNTSNSIHKDLEMFEHVQ